MTKTEEKHIKIFIDHFTKVTIRISSWDRGGTLLGRCSGFLYQTAPNQIPVIVTAGHNLPKEGSFIETRIIKDGKTLSINAGKFQVFYNAADIDYAYSLLPVELYRKEIEKYQDVEFTSYQHEFVKALKDEAYGFSVINNFEFVKGGDGLVLPTYCCYEVGLELVDQDEHMNVFKLAREFPGDEYYEGASGSPIADPQGQITSILVGRVPNTELLKASRLDNAKLTFPERDSNMV